MSQQTQENLPQDPQARLDFLEAALPALIQQRNDALDAVVKTRAEAMMHIGQMQRSLAKLEAQVKEMQAGKQEVANQAE